MRFEWPICYKSLEKHLLNQQGMWFISVRMRLNMGGFTNSRTQQTLITWCIQGGYHFNCPYKIPKDTESKQRWQNTEWCEAKFACGGGRVSFEAVWTCVAWSAEWICMCFTVGYITAPSHPPGWILCLLLRTEAALLSAAMAGNI